MGLNLHKVRGRVCDYADKRCQTQDRMHRRSLPHRQLDNVILRVRELDQAGVGECARAPEHDGEHFDIQLDDKPNDDRQPDGYQPGVCDEKRYKGLSPPLSGSDFLFRYPPCAGCIACPSILSGCLSLFFTRLGNGVSGFGFSPSLLLTFRSTPCGLPRSLTRKRPLAPLRFVRRSR